MNSNRPAQYVLGYVQAFIEAQATDMDKPHMERLVLQARRLVSPKPPRLSPEKRLYVALACWVVVGVVLIIQF